MLLNIFIVSSFIFHLSSFMYNLFINIIELNLKDNIFINYMNAEDNIESLIKKLQNCIEIHQDNYEDLERGVWIKYITSENKYRSGGILILNKYPEYLVLKNPYSNKTWCVNLIKNTIFVSNKNSNIQEMIEKNNLYKLYKQGYIKILDEPDEEFLKQNTILDIDI